jgi:hypothetical protein
MENWGAEGVHVEQKVICAKCGREYCRVCNSCCPDCSDVHIKGGSVLIKWGDKKQPMCSEHIKV